MTCAHQYNQMTRVSFIQKAIQIHTTQSSSSLRFDSPEQTNIHLVPRQTCIFASIWHLDVLLSVSDFAYDKIHISHTFFPTFEILRFLIFSAYGKLPLLNWINEFPSAPCSVYPYVLLMAFENTRLFMYVVVLVFHASVKSLSTNGRTHRKATIYNTP